MNAYPTPIRPKITLKVNPNYIDDANDNIVEQLEYDPYDDNNSLVDQNDSSPSTATDFILTNYFKNDKYFMVRYLLSIGAKISSSPPPSNYNTSPIYHPPPSFDKETKTLSKFPLKSHSHPYLYFNFYTRYLKISSTKGL